MLYILLYDQTKTVMTSRLMSMASLVDSVKGRTIGVSPDGVYVVVGFKEGTLRVFRPHRLIPLFSCLIRS